MNKIQHNIWLDNPDTQEIKQELLEYQNDLKDALIDGYGEISELEKIRIHEIRVIKYILDKYFEERPDDEYTR